MMKYALLAVGTFAVTAGSVRLSMGTTASVSSAVLAIVLGAMCAVGLFVLEALDDNRERQRLADDETKRSGHRDPRHAKG